MSKAFPFIPENLLITPEINISDDLPIFKEWATDFEKNELKLKDGRPYIVEKNEALQVWIWKALQRENERFNFTAYSNNYGNEIYLLLSRYTEKEVTISELKRTITDALLVNPYIKSIENFDISIDGSYTNASFDVITIYGKTSGKTEVAQ